MSEAAVPQCFQCIHNINDGGCYRDNNGKKLEQLKTVCPSRSLYHNCVTCTKSIERLNGNWYPMPGKCDREKRVGIGLCRGDWVQDSRFDNILEAKQA